MARRTAIAAIGMLHSLRFGPIGAYAMRAVELCLVDVAVCDYGNRGLNLRSAGVPYPMAA